MFHWHDNDCRYKLLTLTNDVIGTQKCILLLSTLSCNIENVTHSVIFIKFRELVWNVFRSWLEVRLVCLALGGRFGIMLCGIPSKTDGRYFGRYLPFFLIVSYPVGQWFSHITVSLLTIKFALIFPITSIQLCRLSPGYS